eukprot:gene29811-38965_t
MSSTGSGYDYSCGTFSPDGRIFQVEYAIKAVENSGTAVGIKCNDGVVIAVGKPQGSKMLVAGSNRRVFGVDVHAGIAITGYAADGRQIVNRAREEADNYKDSYGHNIIPSILTNRLALYMHYFTIYGSLRPFGASALLAAYDEDIKAAELYMIEPSGAACRYLGCAAGKGANNAKTELEKLLTKHAVEGISCNQAVFELAKILQLIRDESREKPLELEMGWISAATNFKHVLVPKDLVLEADKAALAAVAGQTVPTEVLGAAEEKVMDVVV